MKKTLATLLVVALVASLCGVMFVSAEATNLVAGKTYEISEQFHMSTETWGYDETYPVSYPDDGNELTDGVIPEAKYDDAAWTALHQSTPAQTERGYGYVTFDLGAVCDLDEVKITSLKHTAAGISCPYNVEVMISNDGETYESAALIDIEGDALTALADDSVHVLNTAVDASAQYVQLRFVSYNWAFLGEIEILGTAAATEEPEAPAETSLSVTHVNLYSWNAYRCQIITGEGNDSTNYPHVSTMADAAFDATGYVVLKVENVDGVYTVTAIEGAGVEKTLKAPADGFLLYCGSNDVDNMPIIGNVEVGEVLLDCTIDWHTDVASAEVVGTMTFGPAPSDTTPDAGDTGILVFAVLAVVAIAGCAVASKIKSAAY